MQRVSLQSSSVLEGKVARSSVSEEEEEEEEEEAAMPFSPRVRPRMSSSSELSGCTVTS